MNVKKIVLGELNTNCYIVSIDDECIIIDPADDFYSIKKEVKDFKVVGCLVTHFHPDHIGALEEVLSYYDLDINKVNSNKFKLEIVETFGHTRDSLSFYFKDENILFDGDFIFKDGVGRTDLGGSNRLMIESINKLKEYPLEVILYPGHGDETTIGREKVYFDNYIESFKIR